MGDVFQRSGFLPLNVHNLSMGRPEGFELGDLLVIGRLDVLRFVGQRVLRLREPLRRSELMFRQLFVQQVGLFLGVGSPLLDIVFGVALASCCAVRSALSSLPASGIAGTCGRAWPGLSWPFPAYSPSSGGRGPPSNP